jgi:hypothetical protein
MNAAARVFALLFVAVLAMTGCSTTPDYPPPAADKAQIVVKVTATPKTGASGPHTEGQYDKESVEKGKRFTRVNYSKMDCIAVVVSEVAGLNDDIADLSPTTVELGGTGFKKDLQLVYLKKASHAFHGAEHTLPVSVYFANDRDGAVTLYGSVQGSDASPFEVKVPAHGQTICQLSEPGLYDVYCDEDEGVYCQILATTSPHSTVCKSGGEAFFDSLPPGAYDVEVYAPRLPMWKAKVTATAGKRETLYAEVTVNGLPKK